MTCGPVLNSIGLAYIWLDRCNAWLNAILNAHKHIKKKKSKENVGMKWLDEMVKKYGDKARDAVCSRTT